MQRTFSFGLLAALCAGLLALTGCHSKTESAQVTSGPSGRVATASAPGGAAQQSAPLTRADLNPAMSDRQKDIILRHKNRL